MAGNEAISYDWETASSFFVAVTFFFEQVCYLFFFCFNLFKTDLSKATQSF